MQHPSEKSRKSAGFCVPQVTLSKETRYGRGGFHQTVTEQSLFRSHAGLGEPGNATLSPLSPGATFMKLKYLLAASVVSLAATTTFVAPA
jgi:hypothetical protein